LRGKNAWLRDRPTEKPQNFLSIRNAIYGELLGSNGYMLLSQK